LNKLLICLLTILTINTAMAQDEFFTPGYTIGGYGELHWNQNFDSNGERSKNTLDFHRFIIYYGYNWTEKWSFKSEVELEHNYVSGGNGELELEQAFVNYHSGNWGFQGGVILPSVGLINEYHEPPLFLSVERPTYNKYIIPTTWFANGFAFYGNYKDFGFRLAIIEDLDGNNISHGIRSGRAKGYKSSAENWTKNLSLNYTGINGLRLGGSLTMNDAPRSEEYTNDADEVIAYKDAIGVSLMELNAKYDAINVYAVVEYGKVNYTDNYHWISKIEDNPTTTEVDETTAAFLDNYDSSSGYYIDLGYNIASLLSCDATIMPWIRLSNVAKVDGHDSQTSNIFRAGLTYKPINNVAFKFDIGKITNASHTENPTTEINIGLGYNF
jgi:hypothetical protein